MCFAGKQERKIENMNLRYKAIEKQTARDTCPMKGQGQGGNVLIKVFEPQDLHFY